MLSVVLFMIDLIENCCWLHIYIHVYIMPISGVGEGNSMSWGVKKSHGSSPQNKSLHLIGGGKD